MCREDPEPSKCLGVFGLSLHTTERELDKEFRRFGPIEKIQGRQMIFFCKVKAA